MSNGKKSAVSAVHPDAKAADVPTAKRPTDVFECLSMICDNLLRIAVALEGVVVAIEAGSGKK